MTANRIVARTADELYRQVLAITAAYGEVVTPRGQPTRELRHPTLILTDARSNVITSPARKLNYPFSVAEWLWILLGHRDVATISYFNKNIAQFSDDGVVFAGAYGPPFLDQIGWAIDTLHDHDSRQAVVTFWRPAPAPSRDIPCTTTLQFMRRAAGLELHVYMRSNDAWLGFPYDLFTFTQLQAYVARAVGDPVAGYYHTVGSLHIYDRDAAKAAAVVEAYDQGHYPFVLRSPDLTYPPDDLDTLFGEMAGDTILSRHFEPASVLAPWNMYLSVLAYRTHRDAARVLPPYGALIAAQAAANG